MLFFNNNVRDTKRKINRSFDNNESTFVEIVFDKSVSSKKKLAKTAAIIKFKKNIVKIKKNIFKAKTAREKTKTVEIKDNENNKTKKKNKQK